MLYNIFVKVHGYDYKKQTYIYEGVYRYFYVFTFHIQTIEKENHLRNHPRL